ncbi:head-tail connector protein [Effusibacillus pohliae]|uniref:phage head-tail connector protein n=1 Tax=Effusibacillus pohliae TaxID=232270 RepID=UPI000378239E|nr:phage head-tail connector protein [Effusibacillus pohliae]
MALGPYALLTLVEAKDYLKIEPADTTEDALLERLIDRASSMLERKYGRPLKERAFTDDVYNGSGDPYLVLRTYPVTVTEVKIDDVPILSTDYVVQLENGILVRRGIWPEGIGNIKVSFTGGYQTVPDWLNAECLQLVADLYEGRWEGV